jgi:hypothetical protein
MSKRKLMALCRLLLARDLQMAFSVVVTRLKQPFLTQAFWPSSVLQIHRFATCSLHPSLLFTPSINPSVYTEYSKENQHASPPVLLELSILHCATPNNARWMISRASSSFTGQATHAHPLAQPQSCRYILGGHPLHEKERRCSSGTGCTP